MVETVSKKQILTNLFVNRFYRTILYLTEGELIILKCKCVFFAIINPIIAYIINIMHLVNILKITIVLIKFVEYLILFPSNFEYFL